MNELTGASADNWVAICPLADIVPDTGVCALLGGRHVAVFRVGDAAPRVYAIDNVDPSAGASVLSRGLVGSIGERVVVASPIYKQHFDLASGECLEAPEHSVTSWPARLFADMVWVAL
ncbi:MULTISPECIES: nitrite reductase small subunit NirD [unclassified Janthinobacterium]|uniref:nitrite reductase small subunit NirD n=1 Tax=unclassified Janthinobacterium TaxID=2610881 RepID=UPI000C6FE944|nr:MULTISPECIES: nitrite reductase small subunit NirD [unclassified Janthinobacterium]